MKLKIIETPDYILAVSDENTLSINGDYFLEHVNGNLHQWNMVGMHEGKSVWINKVVSYLPKNNAPELDLPLLPEIGVEDDVEKLACKEFCFPINLFYEMKKCSQNEYLLIEDYGLQNTVVYFQCVAYIKAATKVYSEQDLRKAIKMAQETVLMDLRFEDREHKYEPEEIIQSLKQPKTPKWFVAEKEYLSNDGNWKNVLLPSEWEVDTQFRYRTTAANGKTYLVGTYE